MYDIVDKLIQFSDQHDLWFRTRQKGVEAIFNYFQVETEETEKILPGLTGGDLQLERKNQKLTFSDSSEGTFTVSTQYLLYSKHSVSQISELGYYALDVNFDGENIDDWLVFF